MVSKKEIPALVKLLDDDSPTVRAKVSEELSAFGLALEEALIGLPFAVNARQKKRVDDIVAAQKREWLAQAWTEWVNATGPAKGPDRDYVRLETGLTLLSRYLSDWSEGQAVDCGVALDNLAEAARQAHPETNPIRLAHYLFQESGYGGNELDYYNPQNSNLGQVLKKKQGIPISLASLYMLVGWRLGLTIEGCQFPGHFLGRFYQGRERIFVDCFNGGLLIREADLLRHKVVKTDLIKRVVQEPATPVSILQRFLVNLIRIYQQQEEETNSEFLKSLFEPLNGPPVGASEGSTAAKAARCYAKPFTAGRVIGHRRYDYRGLIVNVTMECQADDAWYYANQTQPRREQPWYHVLVHNSDQVTYVAHTNIVADDSHKVIKHPLVPYFFSRGPDGRYIRNDTPWPEAH